MNRSEATRYAKRITNTVTGTVGRVVRILPANIDTPRNNDNGWDVEIDVRSEVRSIDPKVFLRL